MSDTTVTTVGADRRADLIDVLAAAFAADPVVTWLLGPRRTDVRHLRRFFRALVTPPGRRCASCSS